MEFPTLAVSVNFEREDYTFAENDEQGVVRLIRSGGTAEMFTITIVSGKHLVNSHTLIP